MARGGKREGAGRKEGALTVRTREIAVQAAAEGIGPVEVMLDAMRFFHAGADKALRAMLDGHLPLPKEGADSEDPVREAMVEGLKEVLKLRLLAVDCADRVAPFVHPKMAPVQPGKGQASEEDEQPLVARLKRYATAEAIEQSAGKVVKLEAPRPAPSGRNKAKSR